MTLVFLPRYQKARKLPLVLVGAPRKGQSPGWVSLGISSALPHTQVDIRCAFRQASPGPLPTVFTIKLLAESPRALFPSVHDGSCNTPGVCHQLSNGFELQHGMLGDDEGVKIRSTRASSNLNLSNTHCLHIGPFWIYT